METLPRRHRRCQKSSSCPNWTKRESIGVFITRVTCGCEAQRFLADKRRPIGIHMIYNSRSLRWFRSRKEAISAPRLSDCASFRAPLLSPRWRNDSIVDVAAAKAAFSVKESLTGLGRAIGTKGPVSANGGIWTRRRHRTYRPFSQQLRAPSPPTSPYPPPCQQKCPLAQP